ncbi:hypothetical protein HW532_02225 [Kaustia mangrovi]|uniref:Gamma-glutamylcyclotransferase n=1 Tax=Kaustia mangrovi TaxID=2593653 RepID=A0A7S8C1H8_9HYPH|nr:hypothetical protein [Kaustia mangrovi]QPC41643.1 hypothetical protein HW532_02225 [Kaustia mangrovi]
MQIAIIGYGSLIWDLESLAPHTSGGWRRAAGPDLPVEFSRISPKRLDSLVLVLDPEHGAPMPSSYIASARRDIEEAISDLAARERAPAERIGFVDARTGGHRARVPRILNTVAAWVERQRLDGAVWADLDGNFAERTGQPFSLEAGHDYLKTISGASLAEAKRYIDLAPGEIKTPLRRRLDADPWWQGLPAPVLPA